MSALSKTFSALTLASTVWFVSEAAGQTPTPTLDQIRSSKTLRIAYDPDAPPFSYIAPGSPATAAPQGYSVDLCRAVADQFKEQLKIPDLKVAYVAVNSVNRFDTIVDNKADLLCESSTATLSRRAKVDFSIPIFIDGASFAIGPNGPRDVKQLAGKKVAVLPGTTTEQELRRALTGTQINAELVLVKTNQEGIDLLAKGQVAAYFADRATLTFLLRKEKEVSEPADGRHLSQHRADRARPASGRQRFPPRGRHGAQPHLSARRDCPGLQRGFRAAHHAKPSPERPVPDLGLA